MYTVDGTGVNGNLNRGLVISSLLKERALPFSSSMKNVDCATMAQL